MLNPQIYPKEVLCSTQDKPLFPRAGYYRTASPQLMCSQMENY